MNGRPFYKLRANDKVIKERIIERPWSLVEFDRHVNASYNRLTSSEKGAK